MPVQRVIGKNNKPGYRWGKSGHIYYYTPGNKESREQAKRKAQKQGQAVRSTGWKE